MSPDWADNLLTKTVTWTLGNGDGGRAMTELCLSTHLQPLRKLGFKIHHNH